MTFKVGNNFDDCLKIYNSLSEQEKKWFGDINDLDETIVHRKLIKMSGIPAGYCEVCDSSKFPDGLKDDCFIAVAVAPKYRHCGIGFQLVNEVVQNFKGNGFKSLTYRVNKNNVASIKLAESCGLKRLPQNLIDEDIRSTDFVYVTKENFLRILESD